MKSKTVIFGGGLTVVVLLVAITAAFLLPHDLAHHGIVTALIALPAAMPKDLVSLQQLRTTAFAEVEAALAADNQADFDGASANVEKIDAAIANVEKLQKLKSAGAKGTPQSTTEPAGEDGKVLQPFMAKYRNLPAEAHELKKGQVLTVAQSAAFGDLLFAVARAKQGHSIDSRLVEYGASQGANEAVPSDGAFLVEKDIADGLLMRTFQVARIADRARRIPISARSNGLKINALKDDSRATGSRWGGVQGYWIGEGDSLTPTRPKFRQMNLELKKLAGLLYATTEMLQDSVALSSVISQAFPDEFAFMLDDAMFEGTGSAQPLGFMNAGCKVSIAKETGQAAATIVKENIDKMWARCPGGLMGDAEWWINQDCFPQLNNMSMVIGTGGIPVYLPPGGLSQSPYGTLMGRPVRPIEYCSTVGTEGDIVLAVPSQYTIIEKGSIEYATSIHVAFLTDEQAFRFIYRVDGQPVDDKPITPFKGTNKQSPFITLATRA
jgi:HK97 family phage major capsid protein